MKFQYLDGKVVIVFEDGEVEEGVIFMQTMAEGLMEQPETKKMGAKIQYIAREIDKEIKSSGHA